MQAKRQSASGTSARSKSSTAALPSRPRRYKALFNGQGMGMAGVPARDLTPEEVARYGLKALRKSELYEIVKVEE